MADTIPIVVKPRFFANGYTTPIPSGVAPAQMMTDPGFSSSSTFAIARSTAGGSSYPEPEKPKNVTTERPGARTSAIAASALAGRTTRLAPAAAADPRTSRGPPASVPMASPCTNANMTATASIARQTGRALVRGTARRHRTLLVVDPVTPVTRRCTSAGIGHIPELCHVLRAQGWSVRPTSARDRLLRHFLPTHCVRDSNCKRRKHRGNGRVFDRSAVAWSEAWPSPRSIEYVQPAASLESLWPSHWSRSSRVRTTSRRAFAVASFR